MVRNIETASAQTLNVQIDLLSKSIDDQQVKVGKSQKIFDFHKASIDALKSSLDKVKTKDFALFLEDIKI